MDKLSKIETVLNYEVNKKKRRRVEIENRQPEVFQSIIDVVKKLEVPDVLERIQMACDEFFNLEAERYLHEIKKIKLNKETEDCAHHLGICACSSETKQILQGTQPIKAN